MNSLRNRVALIGHLGSNPETKKFDNGNMVTNFSLATNDYYKNEKGEKIEDTQWHNIVAYGKIADIASKFLEKGREVVLEGRLVNRHYNDKDGIKRHITEIVLNELHMVGTNKK